MTNYRTINIGLASLLSLFVANVAHAECSQREAIARARSAFYVIAELNQDALEGGESIEAYPGIVLFGQNYKANAYESTYYSASVTTRDCRITSLSVGDPDDRYPPRRK